MFGIRPKIHLHKVKLEYTCGCRRCILTIKQRISSYCGTRGLFFRWLLQQSLLQVCCSFIEDQIRSGKKRKANIRSINSIVGAVLMGVINLGMSIMGVDANYQKVVKGLVLLAAVIFDVVSKKKGR